MRRREHPGLIQPGHMTRRSYSQSIPRGSVSERPSPRLARLDWEGANRKNPKPRKGDRQPWLKLSSALLVADAISYARRYEGDFVFMVDVRKKAQGEGWRPTLAQAKAILRCRDRDKQVEQAAWAEENAWRFHPTFSIDESQTIDRERT